MQQTLAVKLAPSVEQYATLVATLERFNAACNAIAQVAFRERLSNKFALQKIVYYSIRERFGLSSQMTIRAIAKVVEAYKRDKSIQPRFRPHGALTYDERIMSWQGLEHVSLLTLAGRQLVACRPGGYQQARRDGLRGQADLILRDGVFSLYATLEVPDVPIDDVQDYLGVDLGIVNIAVDSDASVYTGQDGRTAATRLCPPSAQSPAPPDTRGQTQAPVVATKASALPDRLEPLHQQDTGAHRQRHRTRDCPGRPPRHPRPDSG